MRYSGDSSGLSIRIMMGDQNSLENLLKHSDEMASLPQIYHKLSEILKDPDSTPSEISQTIQMDPNIAGKVLKTVNSAFYGLPQQIASIDQAVTLLGRNPLNHLISTAIITGMLARVRCHGFKMREFWEHSVLTALISKFLYAQVASRDESETIFLGGLLHDIGRLLMAHHSPVLCQRVSDLMLADVGGIDRSETEVLGFNHAVVGAQLLLKWQLPPLLVACAEFHHRPERSENFPGEVRTVSIANRLSGIEEPLLDNELDSKLQYCDDWQRVGASRDQWLEACERAHYQLAETMDTFGF